MLTALDELVPLGFGEDAMEAIQEGLDGTLSEDEYHQRLEGRLKGLLNFYKKHGFLPGLKWIDMAKLVAVLDPTLH
jgi:hypothetical protein